MGAIAKKSIFYEHCYLLVFYFLLNSDAFVALEPKIGWFIVDFCANFLGFLKKFLSFGILKIDFLFLSITSKFSKFAKKIYIFNFSIFFCYFINFKKFTLMRQKISKK